VLVPGHGSRAVRYRDLSRTWQAVLGAGRKIARPERKGSGCVASKKSRTTYAKMVRERERKERRELKQEKKQAARMAKALDLSPPDLTEPTK
jgi:hypothetical protein